MSSLELSDEEWSVLRRLAKFFNQFITYDENRPRYSYIDRLAAPYNPKVVEVTVQEALREARSAARLAARSAKFDVPTADDVRKFLELCNKDLRYSTIVSALALARQSGEA